MHLVGQFQKYNRGGKNYTILIFSVLKQERATPTIVGQNGGRYFMELFCS